MYITYKTFESLCCTPETNTTKPQFKKTKIRDFPGGTVVKNPPANAGDTGSSPGPGRSHMLQSS